MPSGSSWGPVMQHPVSALFEVIAAVIALGVALQAIVLLGIFLSLKRAVSSLRRFSDIYEGHLGPLVDDARSLFRDLYPRLSVTTQHLRASLQTIREVGARVDLELKGVAAWIESRNGEASDPAQDLGAQIPQNDWTAAPHRTPVVPGPTGPAKSVIQS